MGERQRFLVVQYFLAQSLLNACFHHRAAPTTGVPASGGSTVAKLPQKTCSEAWPCTTPCTVNVRGRDPDSVYSFAGCQSSKRDVLTCSRFSSPSRSWGYHLG